MFKRKTTDDFIIDHIRAEIEVLRADLCEIKREFKRHSQTAVHSGELGRIIAQVSCAHRCAERAVGKAEKTADGVQETFDALIERVDNLATWLGKVDDIAQAAEMKNVQQDHRIKQLHDRIDRLLETTNSLKTAVKQTAMDVVTADTIARTQEDRITAAEAEAHLAKEAAFEANTRVVNLEVALRDCTVNPTRVADLVRRVTDIERREAAKPKPPGVARGKAGRDHTNDLIDLVIDNIRGGQAASLIYVSGLDRLRYLRDRFSNQARHKYLLKAVQFSPQILMIGGGLDAVPADGNWCQVQFQVSDPEDPCPPTTPPPPTGCRVYLDHSIFSSKIRH